MEPSHSFPKRIHLGCGARRITGWWHVDARPLEGIDTVATAETLDDALGENVAEVIYWSHGLEHVRWSKRLDTLRALWRVLEPGGRLYLAVPDLYAIFGAVINHGVSLDRIQGKLYGHQDYADNHHHCGWDFESLSIFMREAGFVDIRRWDAQIFHSDRELWDYSFDTLETRDGIIKTSLNLRGEKPK